MLSKYQCLDLFNCNPKQYVFQIKDQWRMKIDILSTYRQGHKHQAPNTNVKLFFSHNFNILKNFPSHLLLNCIRCVISQVQNQSKLFKLQYINHIMHYAYLPTTLSFTDTNFQSKNIYIKRNIYEAP